MRRFAVAAIVTGMLSLAATGAFAFGAIAVDDDFGDGPDDAGYAIITGSANRNAASAAAVEACVAEGNESCRVVIAFPACGAYAASADQWGAAAGNTLQQAEMRALADCGGPDCRIVVSDCE
jgi:hypothetical protein